MYNVLFSIVLIEIYIQKNKHLFSNKHFFHEYSTYFSINTIEKSTLYTKRYVNIVLLVLVLSADASHHLAVYFQHKTFSEQFKSNNGQWTIWTCCFPLR